MGLNFPITKALSNAAKLALCIKDRIKIRERRNVCDMNSMAQLNSSVP